MKTNVLVVSDLHVGSLFGLMPPGFRTADGRIVDLNPGQKHLWKCWQDATSNLPDIDVTILNGDLIDGKQQAQRGSELCLGVIEDQAEAAEAVLQELKEKTGSSFYVVQGTEYHVEKAAREEEAIAKSLGAKRYNGLGTGHYSHEVLDLDIDGVCINFAHHIGVGGGIYRSTAADREGIWSALAGKDGKAPKADAVVRSHAHSFVHVEHASKHIVVTPCWELQTRFMRHHSAYRMLPDIGLIWIEVDSDRKRKGLDPVTFRKRLYPLPPLVPTKFER